MIINRNEDKVTFVVCTAGVHHCKIKEEECYRGKCKWYLELTWNWIDYITKKSALGKWKEL